MTDLILDGDSFAFDDMCGTDGRGMTEELPASGDKPAETRWDRFIRNMLITVGICESAYNLLDLVATSSSSVTIGTGDKSFTVATGLGFKEGMRLVAANVGDAVATRVEGACKSYNSGTGALVITVDVTAGAGTLSSWHIYPKQGAMDGPSSSTDYAMAAFSGTTGKLLRQISSWIFDASSNLDAGDKLLSRAVLKDTAEKKQDVTASSTTDIDITSGNVVNLSQAVNITTLNLNNPSATGNACWVHIVRTKDNSGTARTIAWPATVKWSGGVAPILSSTANAVDVISLLTMDAGTTWYGFTGGLAFA